MHLTVRLQPRRAHDRMRRRLQAESASRAPRASIERFEHFELDIRERLGLDHPTQKHDVAGAELGRRRDATANTVAGMCGARESEQSERAENEDLQWSLH